MQTIEHNSQRRHFTMPVEGHHCVLEYELEGTVMTITHTRVPDALAGRGLAGILTRHVLEFAQNRQWQVVPQCSYVAAYIGRHPEYRNLLQTP